MWATVGAASNDERPFPPSFVSPESHREQLSARGRTNLRVRAVRYRARRDRFAGRVHRGKTASVIGHRLGYENTAVPRYTGRNTIWECEIDGHRLRRTASRRG